MKKNELTITEWLFQEIIDYKTEKIHAKQLKQVTRDNINLDDKQLNKKFAKKMINLYYFTDRVLQVGLKNTVESDHINLANSTLNI